jgi:hypothetical protein
MKNRKGKGDTRRTATRRKRKTTRSSKLPRLSLDTRGYPTGQHGIVWATYDHRQADIIRNALLTQRIACELKTTKLDGRMLYLLGVADERGVEEAMDFVWRDKGGLRLIPDWSYMEGETNRSFEQWLNGH